MSATSIVPSSVTVTGSGSESATVSEFGQVVISSAVTCSLNDVFSATYQFYIVTVSAKQANGEALRYRLRSSGTDSTSGYNRVAYSVEATTEVVAKTTSDSYGVLSPLVAGEQTGVMAYFANPAQTIHTLTITESAWAYQQAGVYTLWNRHAVNTAYDGISLINSAGNPFDATVQVFGLEK